MNIRDELAIELGGYRTAGEVAQAYLDAYAHELAEKIRAHANEYREVFGAIDLPLAAADLIDPEGTE